MEVIQEIARAAGLVAAFVIILYALFFLPEDA